MEIHISSSLSDNFSFTFFFLTIACQMWLDQHYFLSHNIIDKELVPELGEVSTSSFFFSISTCGWSHVGEREEFSSIWNILFVNRTFTEGSKGRFVWTSLQTASKLLGHHCWLPQSLQSLPDLLTPITVYFGYLEQGRETPWSLPLDIYCLLSVLIVGNSQSIYFLTIHLPSSPLNSCSRNWFLQQ